MRNQNQANLPPMEVRKVGERRDDANSVGNQNFGHHASANSVGNVDAAKVGSLDLVTIARLAAKRCGYYDKELADIFELGKSDFSKAFDVDDDTRNKPMKAQLPKEFAEAFVRVMAETLGLRIGGSEQQSRAFKNVLRACQELIEVSEL